MGDFTIEDMLAIQQALQEKYKDKWEPIGPEAGKHKLLWMLGEVGEVIDIIKKNGDQKAVEDAEVRQHLVEEMADVLMYYNAVLLCYGCLLYTSFSAVSIVSLICFLFLVVRPSEKGCTPFFKILC